MCIREATAGPIPQIMTACVHTLYSIGLETEALFKAEGSLEQQEQLVQHFDKGVPRALSSLLTHVHLSPLQEPGCSCCARRGPLMAAT